MTCELIGIGSVGDCIPNEGGATKAFGIKASSITNVTLTGTVVSNLTVASGEGFEEYLFDKDATANYTQVGSLNGNRFSIEHTLFMKFGGISATSIDAANKAAACCDTVWILVLTNGVRLLVGLETQAATGAPVTTANRRTRVIPSINTDTTANESRVEFSVTGNSNTFAMTTTLSDSAILAL